MNENERPTAQQIQSRITMESIESTQLEAYGHDAETSTLAVRFRGKDGKPGGLYHYRNVGETEWHAFRDAGSKGSFFIRNIKPHAGRYPFIRVADVEPQADE